MLYVHDAGLMPYQSAWDFQLQLHEQVLSGKHQQGALMLLEHSLVITIGRHPGAQRHLLAPPKLLALKGVEVIETDRGGDITFHGPGQLVAYPIIPLNAYGLNLHSYMRLLESVVIETLATWGIEGRRSEGATGVWVHDGNTASADGLAKVCAMGIKVRRWVTFHGIALNVTTDLSYFGLINPCGLSRPVTSLAKLLGDRVPRMEVVKERVVGAMEHELGKCQLPARPVEGAQQGVDGGAR
jgi:lipoate-protein ligase B